MSLVENAIFSLVSISYNFLTNSNNVRWKVRNGSDFIKIILARKDNRDRCGVDDLVADILCRLLRYLKITDRARAMEAEINRRNGEKVLGEGLIQPVSFLMFNRDFEPMSSHAGFRKGISSRATVKRTTEPAGLRCHYLPVSGSDTDEHLGWIRRVG